MGDPLTYFIVFLTILSLVYAGYIIFYWYLTYKCRRVKKRKIHRVSKRKYDTLYITKEIFLSEDESHWAGVQADGYTIVVLNPEDPVQEKISEQEFRLRTIKKARAKIQLGLEQAKRREFSNNPPDLEADQDFVDSIED